MMPAPVEYKQRYTFPATARASVGVFRKTSTPHRDHGQRWDAWRAWGASQEKKPWSMQSNRRETLKW